MARENKQTRHEKRFGKPERLADKLISCKSFDFKSDLQKCSWYREDHLKEVCAIARNFLPLCKIIDASNVLEYVHNVYGETKRHPERDYEYRDIKEGLNLRSLIPTWKPPFKRMFIEMSGYSNWHPSKKHYTLGYLFSESEPSSNGDGTTQLCIWKFNDTTNAKGEYLPPEYELNLTLDMNGQIIDGPQQDFLAYSSPRTLIFANSLGDLAAFQTIAFMHCKNVSTPVIHPDHKLNQIRKRHGLKPFLRYHTINIEPMKSVLRTETNGESSGPKKSLHIRRGNFATYGTENRLFGRLEGTFWRESTVCGSHKNGVVKSDYRVNAPAPAPTNDGQ